MTGKLYIVVVTYSILEVSNYDKNKNDRKGETGKSPVSKS